MTHTLHRRGSRESLSGDYTMIMLRAVGYNEEDHVRKIREFLRIALRHNAVNIGSVTGGGIGLDRADEVIANAGQAGQAAFATQEDVTAVLKELKEADLGISVTVGGIFDKVDACLAQAGLKHHTANFSLGIWGRTEKLPADDILEVTTMCGHGMISANRVRRMVSDVKAGVWTPEEAAALLAPACACGVFNPVRTAKLLREMAAK
jgi:hypothetical protein